MLAIKECLIREGVLNLNPPNLATNSPAPRKSSSQCDINSPYILYGNRFSVGSNLNTLDYPQRSDTDNSVNDLSSAKSATAKTSCHQQQQQQQQQEPKSIEQENNLKSHQQTRKLSKRYQGHHPHFHHHTAPAYYTDLQLKIPTPETKDSVNENYQSVYRTPSKLIKDEHQFPTSVSSPLALSPEQRSGKESETLEKSPVSSGTFFCDNHGQNDQLQQLTYNDPVYMPFKNSSLNSSKADIELPPSVNVLNRSRNNQRFASRKRAVRVRSESRPISALYNIICKEKGLDIATTTTNDEDSSPSPSRNVDDKSHTTNSRSRRSHSRSISRQTKSSVTSSNNSNMSSGLGNNSSGGDHPQHRPALQDGCSRKNFRIRDLQKKGNTWDELPHTKASSLSPGLVTLGQTPSSIDNHNNNSHDPLSNTYNYNRASFLCGSNTLLNSNVKHASLPPESSQSLNPSLPSNTTLNVEPFHMHLSSSSSLQDQPHKGAGTTIDTTTCNKNIHQPEEQGEPDQQPRLANLPIVTGSPKIDRYSRKHRRFRDDKPRRHTDGAIKLFPSDLNDYVYGVYRSNDDRQRVDGDGKNDYVYNDYDDGSHHLYPSANHDLHTLAGNTANAKRYITRSQRTNESRTSPAVVPSIPVLNALTTTKLQTNQQQDLNPSLNFTTETAVETEDQTNITNGQDKEQGEEMTNNSGKKSKTTSTAATTTSSKELKLNIPSLTSDDAASSITSTADKKKEEEKHQNQQRFTSPTSPKSQHLQNNRRISPTDNQKIASSSEAEHHKMSSSSTSSCTHRSNGKLIPSVSVSMKQNLSETHCIASRSGNSSPKSPKVKSQHNNTECTVKIAALPKTKTKSSFPSRIPQRIEKQDDIDDDFLEINDLPVKDDGSSATRPRCSTMYTDSDKSKSSLSNGSQNDARMLDLSPVHKCTTSNRSPKRNEERDKSSKRKSNLNRSLNEEATPDGEDSAIRRRRRRELGMSRPLVPHDDATLKALISPHKTRIASPTKSALRNDLSYHMEMARRGLDLATTSDRRRAQTASPKNAKDGSTPKFNNPLKVNKRSDTMALDELRKERCSEVNRKVNERTRTDLEEIMKIVENVHESSPSSGNAITELSNTMKRLRASQETKRKMENEKEQVIESLNLFCKDGNKQRRPSPIKHATFVQEERIYYEPDPLEHVDVSNGETENLKNGTLRSLRMLKAKSIERDTAVSEITKLSPILRRKSTDATLSQGITASATPNHIVSILKKKDHLSAGESSSASSNASPVTFSSSVMDTSSKQKRTGILKKRSSLDESRYYSRSHSPDERSILIKSARRNSLEEIANANSSCPSVPSTGHHGILKQSSYDSSKSDGCPSASREPLQPHSILKKKDSTSTPSDGGDHAPKHVSISQAVILAAAELSAAVETRDKFSNDDFNYTPNSEEYDIKPILKLDSSAGEESAKPPKPILKKKSSGDSDEHEIKPILKTSRKSSREEFEFGHYSDGESQHEPLVKPILKTDSPSKRRSLGETDSSVEGGKEQRELISPFLLKRRTRSLERHDQAPVIDLAAALNAIATSQALPSELVSSLTNSTADSSISVAERIKSVEKFLANQSGLRCSPGDNTTACASTPAAVNTSWESPLQNDSNNSNNHTGALKVLKPSVIKRDLYKDRYKTQPVTSDEKNFFKSNASSSQKTLSIDTGFKPAQSLEGLGFPRIFSHGNQLPNTTPSAFALTRSFTQPLSSPLHSPQESSSFKPSFRSGVPVPLPRKSPARSNLLCSQDNINLRLSFTGPDPGLSCNSNSERIFEMSSLEQDVDMGENQEPKTPLYKDSSESSTSSAGVVRTNSVKARANMFQQLQEKANNDTSLNREERTSPKRAPRILSRSPAEDEPKTPSNPPLNSDDEIEPSSLPVSERLRFFSSLTEASKRNSYCLTRSPPFNSIERSSSMGSCHYYMATTPRSSTSVSSASVTPTPMESPLPIFIESPTILKKDSPSPTEARESTATSFAETSQDLTDSRFAIKADIVKTSPFLQAIPPYLGETKTTTTSALTPIMKRVKLRTIGKLMLPSTFLNNDRNNNNSKDSCMADFASSNSFASDSNGENEHSGPPKKIGKIKSPFIENCNQKQQKEMNLNTKCMKFDYSNKAQYSMALSSLENNSEHHSVDVLSNSIGGNGGSNTVLRKYLNSPIQTNGHHQQHSEDLNTDSGKENVDTSLKEQTTPVIEIRRKFTRKSNTSQSFNTTTGGGVTRQLTPRSASLNGPHSSPHVDNKYAKYFGLITSINKSAKTKPLSLPKHPLPQYHHFGIEAKKSLEPQPIPINRNVCIWRSSGNSLKRVASVIKELKKFEDIIVTEKELRLASVEFDSLLHNESMLKHSPIELERIFSSIV